MKSFGGWQFPDHEVHLLGWLEKTNDMAGGRLRYQGKKQDAVLEACPGRRVAVDVGAHVGLWSFYLAAQFGQVHAFEPVAEHRACFAENVGAANVTLYDCALGDRDDAISIHTSVGSSGDSYVDGAGEIPMHRLDDLDLQLVDLIKLDCEGGELPALRGAEQTLLRCRPTIIVEQKPGRAQKFGLDETAAIPYLQSLGAVLVKEMSGDFILRFD
jgi:FkbM family methyltransferase